MSAFASDPYHLDRSRVAAAFNRAAGSYEAHAALQDLVARRLDERLKYFRIAPRRILDLGAGCGNGSRLLARRYRRAIVVGVDLAVEMLKVARQRAPRWFSRQMFACADAGRLPLASGSVDLVYSSLTLHWCQDLEAVFAEVYRVLRDGGLLLFSTLGPDTLAELRRSFEALDEAVHVHRFRDMHVVGDALVRARFEGAVLDAERILMTYPDVAALMRELKALGVHNLTAGRRRSLTGKGRMRAMIARYEALRLEDGRIPATQEVIYGHAWKPAGGEAALPARGAGGRRLAVGVRDGSGGGA